MATGLILDIDSFSTHDGPGIRTAVFVKGCPLSCKWCHSPESQKKTPTLLYQKVRCTACLRCMNTCKNGAITQDLTDPDQPGIVIDRKKCVGCFSCAKGCYFKALRVSGSEWDAEALANKAARDLPFFENSGGGVTISGGEPLMQPEFTYAFLKACKEKGIHTLMETCGFGSKEALLQIAEMCDMLYFDIKLADEEAHKEWTGVSNQQILKNLTALCENGHADKITIRVPCIPDVNDTQESIRAIALCAKQCGAKQIQLLPYNPMAGEKYKWIGADFALSDRTPRDKAYYDQLNDIAAECGLTVLRD